MIVRFIILLVFSVLIAIFAIQNSSAVEISVIFAKYSVSQAVVILVSAAAGAIIVTILATINQFKLQLKIKKLSKDMDKSEKLNTTLQTKINELAQAQKEEVIKEPELINEESDEIKHGEENCWM